MLTDVDQGIMLLIVKTFFLADIYLLFFVSVVETTEMRLVVYFSFSFFGTCSVIAYY
jgi:hypothetical protein